jgi:hypothetical protein
MTNELATVSSYDMIPQDDDRTSKIRAWCWSGAQNDVAARSVRLINMPNEDQKVLLRERRELLVGRLSSANCDSRPYKKVGAACLQMLVCFSQNQQGRNESEKEYEQRIRQLVAVYVAELRKEPLWIIEVVCSKIRAGLLQGFSPTYAPSTIQVQSACKEYKAQFLEEAIQIGNILRALPAVPPITEEERERVKKKFAELLAGMHSKTAGITREEELKKRALEYFEQRGITKEMLDKIPNAPARTGNFIR